jgi:hypothetical protein
LSLVVGVERRAGAPFVGVSTSIPEPEARAGDCPFRARLNAGLLVKAGRGATGGRRVELPASEESLPEPTSARSGKSIVPAAPLPEERELLISRFGANSRVLKTSV